MSDLTNTPTVRTPAYAEAAERYSREQRLGARVLEILAGAHESGCIKSVYAEIMRAARELGLLDTEHAVEHANYEHGQSNLGLLDEKGGRS